MGVFETFPYTNYHDLNLDWILEQMRSLLKEWEAFEDTVIKMNEKAYADFDKLKQDLLKEMSKCKSDINKELAATRKMLDAYYDRYMDIWFKMKELAEKLEQYVDNAIANLGSLAQFSIDEQGHLTATVFTQEGAIYIEFDMTPDGRLEVIVDE